MPPNVIKRNIASPPKRGGALSLALGGGLHQVTGLFWRLYRGRGARAGESEEDEQSCGDEFLQRCSQTYVR